jgi:hypothetical protein
MPPCFRSTSRYTEILSFSWALPPSQVSLGSAPSPRLSRSYTQRCNGGNMGQSAEQSPQVSCDICRQRPAALQVTVSQAGRRRTLNVCQTDYLRLRARSASPFESCLAAGYSPTISSSGWRETRISALAVSPVERTAGRRIANRSPSVTYLASKASRFCSKPRLPRRSGVRS